jgi:hypothetical protein
MVYREEACAPKWMSSGHREFHVSCYITETRIITSNITYLLSRTKPAGHPLPHSLYALSRTRGLDRGVVRRIDINTDLFILNFCICRVYTYTSLYLQLQVTRTYISWPVESRTGIGDPRSSKPSSHDRCRILEFGRQSDRNSDT